MSDEEKIMLCQRCEDSTPSLPVTVQKCGWCGKDVWVSNASLKTAIDLFAKIKCLQCHAKWLDETKPSQDELTYSALTTTEEWKEFMEHASKEWEGH